MRIYEILTPRQVSHAIAITHDKNNLHKTKTKFTHEDFSEEWKQARAEFISKFPVAEKMFSEEGSAPYQIRKKNVKLVAPSEPDQEVMQYLMKLNPEISNDDYAKGQIEINGRFVKIGKALGKMKAPQHILDQYAHDSFRKESDFGASVYDLVISGNPLDVYGMSTGRPWSSCADMSKLNNMGSDDAAQSMDAEIHNHTHVVYLVTPGGSVRNNAIARRGYKLHVSEDNSTLLPDTSVYEDGDYNIPIDFKKVADKYMHELFKIEKGVYTLASGLYKDGDHIVYDDGEGNGLDSRKMTTKQLYDLIGKMSAHELRIVVIRSENNKKILNKLGLTTDLYYSKIPTNASTFSINVDPSEFSDILPANLIEEYPNLASMLQATPFGYMEYLVKKAGVRDTDTMINAILQYGKKNNKTISDITKTHISNIFTNVKCSYKIADFISFDELKSYLTVDTVHENDMVDVVSRMSKQQWNESKDKINLDTRQLALIILHGTSLANEILRDQKYIDLIKHDLANPTQITAILKIALKQNYYIQDILEENNITV